MRLNLASEFNFIHQYFRPLAGKAALNLADDAALLKPSNGKELVITADAMIEGIHFLSDDPADTIGRKLLRCNLSDLASMGADPVGYLLTLSLPREKFTDEWLGPFSHGLLEDQKQFNIELLGGDTTRSKTTSVLSITMLGEVEEGKALRRNGAKAGDSIWVTGTIGDGALGLLVLQGKIKDRQKWLSTRYRLPQPRIALNLCDIASASMDISDGLVQDLGHILRASQIGAVINARDIPRSKAAIEAGEAYFLTCLTGGDDYELLLTIPPDKENLALRKAEAANIQLTKIGYCTDSTEEVFFLDEKGKEIHFDFFGWSHI